MAGVTLFFSWIAEGTDKGQPKHSGTRRSILQEMAYMHTKGKRLDVWGKAGVSALRTYGVNENLVRHDGAETRRAQVDARGRSRW